jgi:YVTN family beta-propeller protein
VIGTRIFWRILWRIFSLWPGVLAAAGPAAAKPYLFVQNGDSGDVSVISIPEHQLVKIFPVGPHPDDVAGSPDGRTFFVNLGVVNGHSWGVPEAGEIVALSTTTGRVRWRLPVPDGWPHHLSVAKDGRLFVPLYDRAHLDVIDTRTGKLAGRLDGQWGMHGTKLSPDGKRLYVGSILTGSIYVLDIAKNEPLKILSFPAGVRPFTFTRDEKTLYAQLSGLHGFVVVDLDQAKIVKTVKLPEVPSGTKLPTQFPYNVNHGLELSPDEKYLFAAGSIANYVAVYSHPDLKLLKIIPVGADANWITFSPDGRFAYVGCRGSNEVSVISVGELKEIKRVKTGGEGSARVRIIDVPEAIGAQ